jgi:hypothetical protein
MCRAAIVCAALLCVRREDIKVYLFEHKATAVIFHNLQSEVAKGHAGLVKDTCMLLSRMLTDDDYAVQASKAYTYAREVASGGIILELLAALTMHNHEL